MIIKERRLSLAGTPTHHDTPGELLGPLRVIFSVVAIYDTLIYYFWKLKRGIALFKQYESSVWKSEGGTDYVRCDWLRGLLVLRCDWLIRLHKLSLILCSLEASNMPWKKESMGSATFRISCLAGGSAVMYLDNMKGWITRKGWPH